VDQDVNVIIICPCCASPKDVKVSDDEQFFGCTACNQKWSMVVDADRVARNALT
jgi:hypothetical protein